MQHYMESFEEHFLNGRIRYETEILKIKRVDHYWSTWSKSWKYRNTGSGVIAEAVRPVGNGSDNDPWANFCFVVVRKIPEPNKQLEGAEITFQVVVKSPYLLKACKEVIGSIPGLSWTAEPLEVLSAIPT